MDNMKAYTLDVMQKDIIVKVALENGLDPDLLTDDLLEKVKDYMNKVLFRTKEHKTTEDQMGYMVATLILLALAVLEPEIMPDLKE